MSQTLNLHLNKAYWEKTKEKYSSETGNSESSISHIDLTPVIVFTIWFIVLLRKHPQGWWGWRMLKSCIYVHHGCVGVSLKSMEGLRWLWLMYRHSHLRVLHWSLGADYTMFPGCTSQGHLGLYGNTGSLVQDIDSFGQFPGHLMNLAVIIIQINPVLRYKLGRPEPWVHRR